MNILNCTCGDHLGGYGPLLLRVVTGLIFFMHGWMKLSAMGVDGVAGMLGGLGFPAPGIFAVILLVAEIGGGILLVLGVATHWVAKILAFIALVAILTVHISQGFFVGSGGYEFALLLFAAAVSLAITGPGKWALGRGKWR